MSIEKTLLFKNVRETKGTLVYGEVAENGKFIENNRDAVIGTIYVQKGSVIGQAEPEMIQVTVKVIG